MADIDCFMQAIREQESGGNYGSYNPGSGAAGAYQFTTGTWQGALRGAGLGGYIGQYPTARFAPPWLQDSAARWLMGGYFARFGSWYDVAEAWYGGPGAVGHPGWGGGPGYPNVGQYADQVMAKFNACTGGSYQAPPPSGPALISGPVVPFETAQTWGLVQWIYGYGMPGDYYGIYGAAWW